MSAISLKPAARCFSVERAYAGVTGTTCSGGWPSRLVARNPRPRWSRSPSCAGFGGPRVANGRGEAGVGARKHEGESANVPRSREAAAALSSRLGVGSSAFLTGQHVWSVESLAPGSTLGAALPLGRASRGGGASSPISCRRSLKAKRGRVAGLHRASVCSKPRPEGPHLSTLRAFRSPRISAETVSGRAGRSAENGGAAKRIRAPAWSTRGAPFRRVAVSATRFRTTKSGRRRTLGGCGATAGVTKAARQARSIGGAFAATSASTAAVETPRSKGQTRSGAAPAGFRPARLLARLEGREGVGASIDGS